jgi:hypothetical protein
MHLRKAESSFARAEIHALDSLKAAQQPMQSNSQVLCRNA